jgi:riboflavin kinase/FMN adenylyltransferase
VLARRFDGARSFGAGPSSTLVAIGNFDGVHLGHGSVLRAAAQEAARRGLVPAVLTFDPHPAAVLGRAVLPVLTSLDRKVELICRIDPSLAVVVQQFTLKLAEKTPREFVENLLVAELGASVVLVGANFRFGRGRSGDFAVLEQLGDELGFDARVQPLAGDASGTYSSSRIRQALTVGDLGEARRLLGRPHSMSGRVVAGAGRGRQIGVPTANLADNVEALPPHGVYAVAVDRVVENRSIALGGGMANIGVRPTVQGGFSVEVHVFDLADDLYGATLRLHFIERLRDEQRFPSVEALREQLDRDAAAARALTDVLSPSPEADGGWF